MTSPGTITITLPRSKTKVILPRAVWTAAELNMQKRSVILINPKLLQPQVVDILEPRR